MLGSVRARHVFGARLDRVLGDGRVSDRADQESDVGRVCDLFGRDARGGRDGSGVRGVVSRGHAECEWSVHAVGGGRDICRHFLGRSQHEFGRDAVLSGDHDGALTDGRIQECVVRGAEWRQFVHGVGWSVFWLRDADHAVSAVECVTVLLIWC